MEILIAAVGGITLFNLLNRKENFEETFFDSESYYKQGQTKEEQREVNRFTPTEGELTLRESQGMSKEDLEKHALEFIPMGRMNKYKDILPAIIYLLTDNSLMVSGSNIRITGGWFM